MALTEEQELEMYGDIKVIKTNCLFCRKEQEKLEKDQTDIKIRLNSLERAYWVFVGICTAITFALPFIIDFIKAKYV